MPNKRKSISATLKSVLKVVIQVSGVSKSVSFLDQYKVKHQSYEDVKF